MVFLQNQVILAIFIFFKKITFFNILIISVLQSYLYHNDFFYRIFEIKMFRLLFFCTLVFLSVNGKTQCLVSANIYSSNINYYNVDLNWFSVAGAHHYKIRYKVIGAPTWSYKNNIDSLATLKNVANLTPNNTYIWQIRTYCDSTNSHF